MNTYLRLKNQTMRSFAIALCGGCLLAGSNHAGLIFYDNFDSETVGSFPSTWTNVIAGANPKLQVTNHVSAPSTPNVFQVGNVTTNQSHQVWRPFPTYNLNTTSQIVFNYSLNVSLIPQDGFSGFVIVPANLPTQGEETFAAIRVYKGTSAGTWLVQNYYDGLVTNNLALNSWHNFRFEIDPSSTNAQNGVVRWYIDNNFVHSENFIVPSILRTNINTLVARETFANSSPPTTYYLDNVFVYAEIPEPTTTTLLLLTGFGGYLIRRRLRR